MKNEDIIRKAKSARSPEELLQLAKSEGMSGMTEETAGKLYDRLHSSSHELSDEELDVSAGGCFVFNEMVCPNCQQTGNFEVVARINPDGATTTVKCLSCQNTIVIPLSDVV